MCKHCFCLWFLHAADMISFVLDPDPTLLRMRARGNKAHAQMCRLRMRLNPPRLLNCRPIAMHARSCCSSSLSAAPVPAAPVYIISSLFYNPKRMLLLYSKVGFHWVNWTVMSCVVKGQRKEPSHLVSKKGNEGNEQLPLLLVDPAVVWSEILQ